MNKTIFCFLYNFFIYLFIIKFFLYIQTSYCIFHNFHRYSVEMYHKLNSLSLKCTLKMLMEYETKKDKLSANTKFYLSDLPPLFTLVSTNLWITPKTRKLHY